MNKVVKGLNQNKSKHTSLRFILLFVSVYLLTGCGDAGFKSISVSSSNSGGSPLPLNPINSTVMKPTAVEIVSGAGVSLVGSRGSKADISIGDVGKNKSKTANGYKVLLSVSGQNSFE